MKYIHSFIHKVSIRYREYFTRENILSFCASLFVFFSALVIQKIANNYVVKIKGIPVDDIILNYFPAIDVDFFIVQGALLLTLLVVILLCIKPKYINFSLKAMALFIFTRSFFISLTHLGVNPHHIVFDENSIGFGLYDLLYNSQNDFFFSGHTGLPFLLGLIFWREKIWRYVFMITSIIFGVSVLLGHIHYSIDVFAAPLITYSIFVVAIKIFSYDYKLLK